MARRTEPRETVICGRCRRSTDKAKATQMNGLWFGSNCLLYVLSSATADPLDQAERTPPRRTP